MEGIGAALCTVMESARGNPAYSGAAFSVSVCLAARPASIAQIKLKTKSVGAFFGPSLVADQIARSGHHGRLPAEGMILANSDLQTDSANLIGDHVGKLPCSEAFFDHGKNPKWKRPRGADQAEKTLKDPSMNMVDRTFASSVFMTFSY